MEDFKKLPKMQCFNTGGSVAKEYCSGSKVHKKTGGAVSKADVAQDKKIVKKAFGMHDDQLHEGKRTDLSELKRGGRAKKAAGTVRKYKDGGSVTNVYEAKKSSGDKDNINKTKDIKPAKAAAPSKAAAKPNYEGSDVAKTNKLPAGSSKAKKVSEDAKSADAASGAKGGPNKYKKGGKVKKFSGADGSYTGTPAKPLMTGPGSSSDSAHQLALMKEMQRLSPDMQMQLLKQQQAVGGNNSLNAIANQANPQVGR